VSGTSVDPSRSFRILPQTRAVVFANGLREAFLIRIDYTSDSYSSAQSIQPLPVFSILGLTLFRNNDSPVFWPRRHNPNGLLTAGRAASRKIKAGMDMTR
jgi:hypothetical protein